MRTRSGHFLMHAVLSASVLFLAGRVLAHPTSVPLWGPTGLGTIPTTDTVPKGQLEAGLGYERIEPGFGGSVKFSPILSATYGFKNGEVGAGYLREEFEFFGFKLKTADWNANAKYRLWQSSKTKSGLPDAAIAGGVHYTRFDENAGHLTSLYLTGSKNLWGNEKHLLRAHAGVLHQRVSAIDENLTRPMVGVEYKWKQRVTLAADYVPEEEVATRVWSLVARYESTRSWSAQVGYGEFGSVLSDDDKRLFASVAYRFGGGNSGKAAATADEAKPLSGTFTIKQ